MISFKTGFQLFCRTILTCLLVTMVWLSALPAFSALALPNDSNPNYTKDLTQGDAAVPNARKQRIEAVDDCRKYLSESGKDKTAHTDAPLDMVGSDRLVGALKVSDNPNPTEAEVNFKRCLEQAGVAPKSGEPVK